MEKCDNYVVIDRFNPLIIQSNQKKTTTGTYGVRKYNTSNDTTTDGDKKQIDINALVTPKDEVQSQADQYEHQKYQKMQHIHGHNNR